MIKQILISAITIPVLILVIFIGVGFVFLISEFINAGEYNEGWLGLVYAGAVYSYFAVLISTIPTVVVGLPASLAAKKYGFLKRGYIISGASILGGIFMAIASTLLFKAVTLVSIIWFAIAGSIGGLINGYVFWRQMKPNKAN